MIPTHFTAQDAMNFLKAGKEEEARLMFDAIARQEPDNWYSWFYLASISAHRGENGAALAFLYRAASLAPEQSSIWNNLGTTLRREHHVEKAKEALLEGTKLSPDDADLWSNLCTLYVNEGNPELGLEYVNKALKSNPDHINARWNKALLLLETGQLKEGFEMYSAGIGTGERPDRWTHWPTYDPEQHKGKRVLVYGEQGLGDEVMYYSLIPDLLQDVGSLIVECHPRLESLLNRSFPDVTAYPTRKEALVTWDDDFDARMPLGDVAKFYRNKREDFPRTPYLSVDPELTNEYRHRLLTRAGPGPYVGIGWKGGYKKTRKDLRSITLEEMEPIIRTAHNAGAKLVSFQYTDGVDAEVQKFEERTGIKIHHWQDIIQGDYMKTACLLECMDLAITVNTSLVHLAGAIGKELWTLTPKGCAWRYWCWDDRMMWYESVKQYRAEGKKNWDLVVKRVVRDLKPKIDLLTSLGVAKR